MNERRIIAALKATYPIAEGSRPSEITPEQQRAANLVGKLLKNAHRKGRRKKGKWIE